MTEPLSESALVAGPATSEATPEGSGRAPLRAVVAVFVVVFVVYAVSPVRQNYDSYLAFPTAQSIVHDGNLYLDEFDAPQIRRHAGLVEVADDRVANFFPWVPALLLVPSVLVLDAAGVVGIGSGSFDVVNGGSMDVIQMLTASMVVALVAALMVIVVFERLRPSVRHRRRYAVATALLFAFGTAAWSTASRALWQHGPSMLCLLVVVLCLQRLLTGSTSRRAATSALLGTAVALSYAVRPTNAVVVVAVTLLVIVASRSSARWYFVGAAVVAAPWMLVNLMTYRSLLPDYYTGSRLSYHDDFFEALAVNLVSPARGVLVFTPVVVFVALRWTRSVDRHVRPELRALDVTMAVVVVLYLFSVSALTDNWWAGHSFGPRFMSDAMVLLACLLAPLGPVVVAGLGREPGRRFLTSQRLLSAGVFLALAWGVLANAEGALMRSTLCWNGDPDIDQNVERLWAVWDGQVLSGVRAVTRDGLRDAVLTTCT